MPQIWYIFLKIVDRIADFTQNNAYQTNIFWWITCQILSKLHLFIPKIKIFYQVFHKRMFVFTKLSTCFSKIKNE